MSPSTTNNMSPIAIDETRKLPSSFVWGYATGESVDMICARAVLTV